MDKLARARLARAAVEFNRRAAADLPALVFMTDDDRVGAPASVIASLPSGSLAILRAKKAADRVRLAQDIAHLARARGIYWLVADDPELASRLAAHGVHFPEARIGAAQHWRSIRPQWLITCGAHSLRACMRAASAGANAILLAPVFPTRSHAGRPALGSFRTRCIAQQSRVPVYALGGIDAHSARRLRGAKLVGLAAVGALAEQR